MGDVVKFARVGGRRKFEACMVGDLLIGRLAHGPDAGRWSCMEIARVDSDGAVSEILDEADAIAVGRVFLNSAEAPHLIVPAGALKPGGVAALAGDVADDLDDLRDVCLEFRADPA